ncbi:MAG: DUF4838 domain-containing protein, partial [Armatimonadota bacterium]
IQGIGVIIRTIEESGLIEVANVMKDTPAEQAGVQVGDIFIEVDGEDVIGFNQLELAGVVRGPRGSTVNIIFLRDEEGYWWALRNGINGWFDEGFLDSLGSGVGDDLVWKQPDLGGFHAFFRILPPERYRDEHPEYYALAGGRRVEGGLHSGQICTTNEEALNIIARGAREYFEADPDARFYSVAPNDGYNWCTCDDCMALEERLGGPRQWMEGDRMVLSDRQVHFGNEIARRALGDLPGRELIIFAYVNHAPPPLNIHPIDGVTVWLCHYMPACYAHTISDPDCPRNAEFFEYVKGWARWADRMGYYAYTNKSMWGGLPRPVVRPMMQDIRTLYDLGWRRYVAQSNAKGFGQGGSLYWMTARLLWDVDADIDALLDDYFANMYGPAAEEMAAYFATLERAMLEPMVHFTASPFGEGPEVFSREEIEAARVHLEAALAATDDDRIRERIEARRSSLEFGTIKLRYGWAMQQFRESGEREALAEAVEAARAIAEQGGRIGRRFQAELSSLEMLADTGLMLRGMSEPVEIGGRTAWNSDETGPGDNAAGWMTIEVPRADHSRPHILELTVWGKSAGFTPVIATEGGGVGYAQGGVWTPLERVEGSIPDDEQWHTVRWRVEPEQFDPQITGAEIGFGGGDSQIWITDPKFYPVEE